LKLFAPYSEKGRREEKKRKEKRKEERQQCKERDVMRRVAFLLCLPFPSSPRQR
jgi:hypothetical protein